MFLHATVYEDYLHCQTIVVATLLIVGLWLPGLAIVFGVLHIVARAVYAAGYNLNVRSRWVGQWISNFCLFFLVLLAIACAVRATGALHDFDAKVMAVRAAERAAELERLRQLTPGGVQFL